MSFNFLPCDRDQLLLMPPSMAEWLPEDHLAWFLIDAVAEMDLSEFYAAYRVDGWGRAAHHPQVMVTLLLYAYCSGVQSSRRIEQACQSDVAFRVITANEQPDHTTIARFRRRHVDALAGLFVQTLRLCAQAGLVRVGLVALDGTKMAASASLDMNRSRSFIEEQVSEMLAAAEAADRVDEASDDDDDVSPGMLRGRAARLERLRQAKAVLDAHERAERAVFDAKMADRERREHEVLAVTGQRMKGRKPKPFAADGDVRVSIVDADSRVMSSKKIKYLQGYNAQAMATREQVVVAAQITNNAADVGQLHPMIAAADEALRAAGVSEPIRTVVADAGYLSGGNLSAAGAPELLIATRNRRRRGAHETPAPRGRIPGGLGVRERMDRKLATRRGKHLYKQRSQMIEPVFGQIKHNRSVDRFVLRGHAGVEMEWKLLCATHNLLKLFRAGLAAT